MLRTEHKIALICLKYIPIIMFLSMWIYALCGLFGINLGIADTIMGCSLLPSILIFSLSDIFHFCALHKSLTGYSLVVDILINIEKYIGFGKMLFPVQCVVSVIGLCLFIGLITKTDLGNVTLDLGIRKNKKDKIKI